MESFQVLNNNISFSDDIKKLVNLHRKEQDSYNEYNLRYISMSKSVNDINELIDYINDLMEFMKYEFNYSANKILDIFADYKIFDKKIEDIIIQCTSITEFSRHLEYYTSEINKLINKINNYIREVANEAANDVEGAYINIISNSVWSLTVADIMNAKEERRVEKEREKRYNWMVKMQTREYYASLNKGAKNLQEEIYKKMYKYGVQAIKEMYHYCIVTLINNNCLAEEVQEYMQEEKSKVILSNLERTNDEEIKKQQLVQSLKYSPFLKEVHACIIEYINENEINEYIKLINLLDIKKDIIEICTMKCKELKNDEDKYVKIINKIDSQYINSLHLDGPKICDYTIEEYDLNLGTSEFKKLFNMSIDKVYGILIEASKKIGKINEETNNLDKIIINCPIKLSLKEIIKESEIKILLKKRNANQTIAYISGTSQDKNESALKYEYLLLNEIYNLLDNNYSKQSVCDRLTETSIKHSKINIILLIKRIFWVMFISFNLLVILGLLFGGNLEGEIIGGLFVFDILILIAYFIVYKVIKAIVNYIRKKKI